MATRPTRASDPCPTRAPAPLAQARATATAPLALSVLFGLHVNLPAGRVLRTPPRRSGISGLRVDGLSIGGEEHSVTVH